MKTPEILITNDDGIHSNGIAALVEVMSEFGNLTVIAPNQSMSGVGHAITMRKPIVVSESEIYGKATKCYILDGTPADCVKFGLAHVYSKMPDLVVSGINHGSNASVNLLYSGTMAAAIEGWISGIPAIGFSLNSYDENASLNLSKQVTRQVVTSFFEGKIGKTGLFNVNIPACTENEFNGVYLCRQSKARWKETFVEENAVSEQKSFWLTGAFVCDDKTEGTDIWALENNFASLTAVNYDMTDYVALEKLIIKNHGRKI